MTSSKTSEMLPLDSRAPYRFITVLLTLLTLGLVAFAAINLRQRALYQLPTDGVSWVETRAGLVAWHVAAGEPGERAGIEPGDILLGINGRSVRRTVEAVQAIFRSGVWSRASYELKRNGREFQTDVIIAPQQNSRSLHGYLELVGLLYLMIGAFVLLRKWSAPKSLHFYLFCLTSFVLYTFSYTGKLNLFDTSVYWLNVVALVLQPPLFLHFSLTFPSRAGWLRRRGYLAGLLYAPGAVLLAAHALVMAGTIVPSIPELPTRWLLDSLEMLHLGVYFLAGAAALMLSYRRTEDPQRRQQLKWVTRGTVLAVAPFSLLYAIPYFLGLGFIPSDWMKVSVLFLIFLPLTFAYAIFRYRLMDVDVIFRRGVAYALATAAVVGLYFGVVFLFADLFRNAAIITSRTGWLVAIVVTALLFQPLVNWIQVRLDRFFFNRRYDYRQTLLEFGHELTLQTSVEGLLAQIVGRLSETLDVDRVAVFLAEENGGFRLAKARSISWTDGSDFEFLGAPPGGAQGYFFFADLHRPAGVSPASRPALESLGLHYYLPLKVKGRLLGFLGLGRTRAGDFLSSEDVDLLQTIAGNVSMALESVRLYETLERKALEFEQLKDFSENIIESVDVGVVACDLEQRVKSWNSAMERLYGLAHSEAVDMRFSEIFPPELLAELPSVSEARRTASLYKFQLTNAAAQTLVVNLSTVPLLSKDDAVIGRLLIMNDVTERVNLEDQLIQSEKLSSIGLLAAGVAHEVNTPLAVIASQAQMLARQFSGDGPQGPTLDKIIKQAFRASDIVNSLLKFSRVSGSEHTEIDLNWVIREVLSLAEPMLRASKVAVNVQLTQDLPPIFGSFGKLQQVFMNLILNARDAMPRGGELTLLTERENSSVLAEVSDNGVGIAQEHLRKIFDPFFTTKSSSRGTGLGLAVTYGIIREHAGTIQVNSAPGRGTSFRLEFPAARKAVNVS